MTLKFLPCPICTCDTPEIAKKFSPDVGVWVWYSCPWCEISGVPVIEKNHIDGKSLLEWNKMCERANADQS